MASFWLPRIPRRGHSGEEYLVWNHHVPFPSQPTLRAHHSALRLSTLTTLTLSVDTFGEARGYLPFLKRTFLPQKGTEGHSFQTRSLVHKGPPWCGCKTHLASRGVTAIYGGRRRHAGCGAWEAAERSLHEAAQYVLGLTPPQQQPRAAYEVFFLPT